MDRGDGCGATQSQTRGSCQYVGDMSLVTCCSSLRLCVGPIDYCHQDIRQGEMVRYRRSNAKNVRLFWRDAARGGRAAASPHTPHHGAQRFKEERAQLVKKYIKSAGKRKQSKRLWPAESNNQNPTNTTLHYPIPHWFSESNNTLIWFYATA